MRLGVEIQVSLLVHHPHRLKQKVGDRQTIPLCGFHHRFGIDSYHALGPRRFAEEHGLDILALIAEFNQQGPLFESGHTLGRRQRGGGYWRCHCSCGFRTAWYTREPDALAAVQRHLEVGK